MNNTEKRYAEHLHARKLTGEIKSFGFESIKLKLADNTFYTPDFFVITKDSLIEFHEIKGSWKAPHQDDAKVKIKVAAELHFWAKFISAEVIAAKRGGGWKFTDF